MPFCANCGSQVDGRFCPKCGTPSGAVPGGPSPTGAPPPPPQYATQPVAATTGGLTENVAGALCYLLGFITGVLFLVLEPYNKSKFVRFHAFQSIFFHVSFIAFWIVRIFLAFLLPWALHMLVTLLSLCIWLGGFALWLFLMFKAYNNERFKIPIIGDIAEKQS
jgi:uncharacterized membrane protein